MRLNKYLIEVALIFMVMAFWVGKVPAYDMTEYICSLNQGDWWEGVYTYSVVGGPNDGASGSHQEKILINGTESVNGVETIKREILVNESVDRYYCVALDSEGYKLYKQYLPLTGFYYINDPPMLVSPATFEEVGDVINQSSLSILVYTIDTDTHMDTGNGSGMLSFESVEEVTVPAGTFQDCLKILVSSSSQSPTSGIATEFEETSWFAHRVGKVKQETTMSWYNLPGVEDTETTSTWELTDYDVNFPCPMTVALGKDFNGLKTLRKFRDEVLSATPEGQEIIRLYYQLSTAVGKIMLEDEAFKEDVKEMIEGILPLVREIVK